MDEEVEDLLNKNNTDDLDDFNYELTGWDYFQDVSALLFTTVGLTSNIIIIYMIARNARMRTKTNVILMNFALNDALFLLSNIHFLSSLLELFGASHIMFYYNCVIGFLDVGFQFNAILFILILVSNTLMKQKRFRIKCILIGIYSFVVVNFICNMIFCYVQWWPILYLICFVLFLLVMAVIAFKEFNNCYKKWYKKDPLSDRTLFRLNIARIYIGAWLFTFFCYLISEFSTRYIFFTFAMESFMASTYILIYIVCADKNFKICFLNLMQCKGAGDYDVDATITFAEDSSDGGSIDEGPNQVNINFNAGVPQGHTQIHQDISTIRVA